MVYGKLRAFTFGKLDRHLLAVIAGVFLLAIFYGAAPAANPTLTVADGNPRFSSDEISPGQYTAANFGVTPYAGTADPEGKPPKITGESFTVTVDSQTSIGMIAVSVAGATVNVTASTSNTESFDITGTIPTAVFTVSVVVQAAQDASDGNHPVTLSATAITTTNGNGSGNSATEDFEVEALAVDISGPPYVIMDNNQVDINDFPPYGEPPTEQYTARATGGSGKYTWSWSESSNIHNEGYSTDNPITVIGKGPEGAGWVTCVATDGNTGASQIGRRNPFVQDEYVVNETSGPTQVPEGKYIGVFGGTTNNLKTPVKWTALAGQKFSNTVDDTEGFTASIPVPISDVAEASFGFSSSTTTTDSYSYTFSQTYSVAIPPGGQVTVVGYLYHTDYSGTYQVWGPTGVLQSGDWTYDEPADGVGGLVPVDVVLQ